MASRLMGPLPIAKRFESYDPKAVAEAGAKPKARCKSAGGATLGRGRSREAQRQAALRVLAAVVLWFTPHLLARWGGPAQPRLRPGARYPAGPALLRLHSSQR
jgi:hypothetical protein